MKTAFYGRFGALLAGSALVLMTGTAQAAITGSKHDLSSGSTSSNKFSGTGELCVFCHTPHGADTSAVVPLWNRTINTGTVYSSYASLGTSSLNGGSLATGSVSVACLSCHDGIATLQTVINAPGSGYTNAAYSAGTWGAGTLNAGKINTTASTYIGTDLRNDHPISIQYGGGKSGTYTTGVSYANGSFVDTDFKGLCATSATVQSWYVETGINGKQKSDLLLYTRTGTASMTPGAVSQPFMECGTCHDPHEAAAGTFLRTSNVGSALCLSCHNK